MRRVLRENGLSIVLLSLFLLFWLGQSATGHREYNSDQQEHNQPQVGYLSYLGSAFLGSNGGKLGERILSDVRLCDSDGLSLSERLVRVEEARRARAGGPRPQEQQAQECPRAGAARGLRSQAL